MKMMSVTTREEQLEMMKNTSEEFQMLLNSPYDPNRPCGLFEMMVKQAAGYGIRGVIWYQGESDEVHAEIYRDIFLDLVDCWRELWGECLPFLTVQLAPFETWLGNSGERFPEIRRQQRMAAEEKEIYLISISDAGMRYDIHPKRKRPVGERLAMMAEEQLYGMNILGHAPEAREAFAGEDSISVHFNYAGDGLKIVGDTLNAVCVTDSSGRIRKIASFRVEKDILYLTPEDYRRESYAIEFAQTPFYEVNLYNSSDLPALPFLLIARS